MILVPVPNLLIRVDRWPVQVTGPRFAWSLWPQAGHGLVWPGNQRTMPRCLPDYSLRREVVTGERYRLRVDRTGRRFDLWQAPLPPRPLNDAPPSLSAPTRARASGTCPHVRFTKAATLATLSDQTVEPGGGGMASTGGRRPVDGLGFFGIDWHGAQVEGSLGVSAVRVAAYTRRDTPDRPFAVVNDYVASTLGTAVGLPVPPGSLIRFYQGGAGYLSLGFSDRGDRPPPIIPPIFVHERPWDACGVIAFDQWILNTDRHDENLAYLPSLGVAVFDHDLSLINRPPDNDACASLEAGLDQVVKGHMLARHLETVEYFPEWYQRIASIGKREIRRAVSTCRDAGIIDAAVKEKLVAFLEHRQTRVKSYVDRTISEYVKVASWPLGSGEVNDES
jgi:hypothetical protein